MTQEGTPSGPSAPVSRCEDPHLAAVLAAERAGTDYWRDVARQRREEAARVQRRPLVRAAIAVDRRTRAAQSTLARRVEQVGRAGRRAAVVADGWRHRARQGDRRRALREATDRPAPEDGRSVLLVHLGPAPVLPSHPARVELVAAGPTGDRATLTAAASRRLREAVEASDAGVVCLLGPTSEPWSRAWLDHLTAGLGPSPDGEVVATAPVTVHPPRSWRTATAHDLLVRAAGLDLGLRPDGTPVARARAAGRGPDGVEDQPEPFAATAAGLAVDRSAWLAAGGLTPDVSPDLDASVLDLCVRLRRGGGHIRVVPPAVVVDHRPVSRRVELATPLPADGAGWRAVVEAHGLALARAAAGERAPTRATVALTTATPSRKLAARSGDWHFAQGLARALGRAGHRVTVQSHEEADDLSGRACDLRIVLRGLEPVRRTAGQAHVIWLISHPEALDVHECDRADLVLVASERYAAHLRTLTTTPVEVLLQATDPDHFRPRPVDPAHHHPLTVVASTRGVQRRAVVDALAAGLRPAVHGPGWEGQVDPDLLVAEHVPHDLLPVVYSSADVVLNDHWDTMRRWGFVSNRILDVLACGTPVVTDHLPEVEDLFDDLVPTWHGPSDLATIVARVAADPAGTAARVDEARRRVLDSHTFDHRVSELEGHLARHGIGLPAPIGP